VTAALTIVCPHCDTINRVPEARLGDGPVCGRCKKKLFVGQPVELTSANFDRHTRNSDVPVVVDFWADWCGPCKMMAPIFEQVAAEFEPRIRFLKVDTEAEQALAAQYNIRSIPTLMLFRKGAVIAQRAGATNAQGLRNWLRQHAFNEKAA
jgi:thioredoxin 2